MSRRTQEFVSDSLYLGFFGLYAHSRSAYPACSLACKYQLARVEAAYNSGLWTLRMDFLASPTFLNFRRAPHRPETVMTTGFGDLFRLMGRVVFKIAPYGNLVTYIYRSPGFLDAQVSR